MRPSWCLRSSQPDGSGPILFSKSSDGIGDGLLVRGSIHVVTLLTWSMKNILPLSVYEISQPFGMGSSFFVSVGVAGADRDTDELSEVDAKLLVSLDDSFIWWRSIAALLLYADLKRAKSVEFR